jgi:thiol-disulfide isomerase/thioredoxin
MLRPKTTLSLLIAAGLVALIAWKIERVIIGNRPLDTSYVPPASLSARKDDKAPWAQEPVVEPVLAGTLLHGATVEYFEIDGDTPQQLEESLAALGPGRIGAESKTSYHLVLVKADPSDGACGFSNATVEAEITVLMPRWIVMPNATDEARQWWSYRIRELVRQQQEHVDTALKEAQQATPEIRQANCDTGDAVYDAINNRLKLVHVQAAFPAAGADVQFQTPGAVVEATPARPIVAGGRPVPESLSQGPSIDAYSLELHSLGGTRIPMQNQRGRVLFLNFWATWCGPCRAEMPSLASLYSKMKDHDIFFGFLSNEATGAVQSYLSKTSLDLPMYLVTQESSQIARLQALPTTLIISKKGEVALRRVGGMQWDTPEIIKLLSDLEKE